MIGERYLDTEHDLHSIKLLEIELSRRGIMGVKRLFYEYLAASSLWWNIIWWEHVSLDENDVRAGWRLNIIVFGFFALLLGICYWYWVKRDIACGAMVASISLLIMHMITTGIGFSLRDGTKIQK